MNRRDWVLAATSLAGLPMAARAQGGPQEGRDYKRVETPVPVAEGKLEVVEFFGYWCPHCNAFEPALEAWVKKLPAAVTFRRIPVAFSPGQEPLQRLYFAIEAMGQVDTLHRKVFNALHVERKRLNTESDILDWAKTTGTDTAKLADTMKSFAVATKLRQSKQLADGYKIEGVPTLGIQGRFMTSPSIAGSPERALAVADALLAQSRKS
ncbi:MAG: thiol:disulfide interchange protein DsbA/DsbL [Aquabacterium sp.]|nr:thiol:disulfide interchange protein DsbA/DsbL [Aquabacterium sp.]